MKFRGGEFSTGTMRNFQPELTDQACPLSKYRPSVRRIERNIENLLAIPGERRL
jgi:hypothetical protein